MKSQNIETLVKQAYQDILKGLDPGKRKNRPFYNPFIDVIYLPRGSGPFVNQNNELNLEFSHYRFALEVVRSLLKIALSYVYLGIHDYLKDPDTPPLKVPTFRNAPALRELLFEINRIYQEFEPIEEVLTLAMEVSILGKEEGPDFRGLEYFMSLPEQASTIEREGLYSIHKKFSSYFVEAYYDILNLTGGDTASIHLIGTYALNPQLAPLLVFDAKEYDYFREGDLTEIGQKFRQTYDLISGGGMKSNDLPEKWYSKNLVTEKGFQRLHDFYFHSTHSPRVHFFHCLEFLKHEQPKRGKDKAPFEQIELGQLLEKTFPQKLPYKINSILWFIHSAYILDRPNPQEKEHAFDRTFLQATQLLDRKAADNFLEHLKIFKGETDITSGRPLRIIREIMDDLSENPFTKEFNKVMTEPEKHKEDYYSLLFLQDNGKSFPESLVERYKDLITWESIRQQLSYLTDLDEFCLPWEDEETQEVEAFIKENIKIDYVGLNRKLSAMKKE